MSEAPAAAEATQEPKQGKKPLLLIALALLVVLGVGGFFLKSHFLGAKTKQAEAGQQQETSGKESGKENKEKSKERTGPTHLVAIPENITVNLADQATPRYAQIQVAVEVEGEAPKGEGHGKDSEKLAPVVTDAVVMIAGQFTFDKLLTAEGKDEFKQKLVEQINKTLGKEEVLAVYFSNFAMQ